MINRPNYDYYRTSQVTVTAENKVIRWFIFLWLRLKGYKIVDKFDEADRTRY